MLGTMQHYYVAETELGEHEYEDDVSLTNEHVAEELQGGLRVSLTKL